MDEPTTSAEERFSPAAKGPGDENFPVASWLIPRPMRPHVHAFYAFARAADDIADDPRLDSEEKRTRLNAFARAIGAGMVEDDGAVVTNGAEVIVEVDTGPAEAFAQSLAATDIGIGHAADLLAAFQQDAVKNRYRDWGELMSYCRLSAVPCARHILDLHGENDDMARVAADALAVALQVINHIQDCADDYRRLDRVYLPLEWLEDAGAGVVDLEGGETTPGLRRVLDRMLDGVDWLLVVAEPFPHRARELGLALEGAVTLEIAHRLSAMLRAGDPLAGR
ncbi:MAG: squalene/phytoene synthase family protein, partial [Alphaproteobacteria bacterium]|nr:squalene/phytoene synthase family protein [Alphaproteobacteria bacterium]